MKHSYLEKPTFIALSLSLCIVPTLLTTDNAIQPEYTNQHDVTISSLDEGYLDLARSAAHEKKHDQAITYYRKALGFAPNNYRAAFELGNILVGESKLEEAIEAYQQALTTNSNLPEAHYNIGLCYQQTKDYVNAIKAFKKAVELKPGYTKAYTHLGECYQEEKKYTEALDAFKEGLQNDPRSHELLNKTAGIFKELEDFEQALSYYQKALEIEPNNANTLLNCGCIFNMINQWEEAIECYTKILERHPNLPEVLHNIAYSLKKMGKIEEAIPLYDRALELRPDYASSRFSRALAYLCLGDFERGWPEHEWRWKAYNESPKKFSQPLWQGEDPQGKTIFVYAEQGLGDTFQFVRYAKLIKEQGGRVIAQVQRPLKSILSLCPYLDQVVARGEAVPNFDYHIAMMSLPLIYNTRLETIPSEMPYLYADETLIEEWHEKLAHDTKFKIGLCWHGNPNYRTQFLRQAVAGKSTHAATFAPLGKVEGTSLYSLQKMTGEESLTTLDDVTIYSFGEDLDTDHGRFMDTAAIMKNLDLIITIDTSIAHLAGGLGVPVWCLLPEPADWRWLLNRNDTPWYPNMRLFRQPTPGDWDTVIQDIITALQPLLTKNRPLEADDDQELLNEMAPLAELLDKLTFLLAQAEIEPLSFEQEHEYKNLKSAYDSAVQEDPSLQESYDKLLSLNKNSQRLAWRQAKTDELKESVKATIAA